MENVFSNFTYKVFLFFTHPWKELSLHHPTISVNKKNHYKTSENTYKKKTTYQSLNNE